MSRPLRVFAAVAGIAAGLFLGWIALILFCDWWQHIGYPAG